MSKRAACTELNCDNWNEDDPPEEAGVFQTAPREVIEKRVIRTAKRRTLGGTPSAKSKDDQPTKAFSNFFSGFGKSSGPGEDTSSKPNFNFLPSVVVSEPAKLQPPPSLPAKMTTNGIMFDNVVKEGGGEEYLKQLRSLNESLVEWVKTKVEKSPCCILTPVFRDYEKHLQTISSLGPSPSSTTFSFSFNSGGPPAAVFSSGDKEEKENDEEAEVEVYEQKIVTESDALYSQRVKVFVKKDEAFSDRGVGTLYIKKVDGKHQLLVRADTSLGHVLVNLVLQPELPAKRVGNNNVMLVCRPTSDAPLPTTVLLRTKQSVEADTLLKNIETYKK